MKNVIKIIGGALSGLFIFLCLGEFTWGILYAGAFIPDNIYYVYKKIFLIYSSGTGVFIGSILTLFIIIFTKRTNREN